MKQREHIQRPLIKQQKYRHDRNHDGFTGADNENRTRVHSLEGCCSTIELHPLMAPRFTHVRVRSSMQLSGDCQCGF